MGEYQTNLIPIIVIVSGPIGLIPLAVVTMTGFLKISIVLFLIRNALGIQQSPPNLVLYGIALILTVYVTTPLVGEMYRILEAQQVDLQSVDSMKTAAEALRPPLQTHLAKFTNENERQFFNAGDRERLVTGGASRSQAGQPSCSHTGLRQLGTDTRV